MLSADRDVVQILKFSVRTSPRILISDPHLQQLVICVAEWSDHDESQMVAAVEDYEKQQQQQQQREQQREQGM